MVPVEGVEIVLPQMLLLSLVVKEFLAVPVEAVPMVQMQGLEELQSLEETGVPAGTLLPVLSVLFLAEEGAALTELLMLETVVTER